MSVTAVWQRIANEQASSRTAGLLRIGLALIALTRFADAMLPFQSHSTPHLMWGVLFYVTTLLMLVGYRARVATFAAGAVQLGLSTHFGYHHHTYLLAAATLLLALTPCDRSYSLDRFRDPPACRLPERGPSYGYTLIGLQLSSVYAWGLIQKLTPAYISGEKMDSIIRYYQFGSDEVDIPGFAAIMTATAIASLVIEAVLIVALWVRRWQRWSIPLGIVFHGAIYYLLHVDTFSITMWLLYLAYVDPEQVHRALDKMQAPPAS